MISVDEMRKIERDAIAKGISALQLMENAGANAARIVNEICSLKGKNVVVFCGTGNNGGDGFCFARHASIYGAKVTVFIVKKASEIKTEEARANYNVLKNYGFEIYEEKLPREIVKSADIIIDALLGIGIRGEVREPYLSAIETINNSKALKISLDCPSGLDADTGKILGAAVKPDLTITFHDIKRGLFKKFCGEIRVASLGIPSK